MIKHAMNFRLNQQAINILVLLEKKLHTTKTAVIEAALQDFAKRKLAKQNELLSFAGLLKDDEAKDMLQHIRGNRHNKSKDIEL
jgi:predicted transcriptional regulator